MASKTKPFNATQFTPTEWATAEEKATFANKLLAFIDNDFPATQFSKRFYNRLSNCRGHIAHYNRDGFYGYWFAKPDRRVDFVQQWADETGICGDPHYTFSDVERAVAKHLTDTNALARQTERANVGRTAEAVALIEERRRLEAQGDRVQFKVAAKSGNTGSFGHTGYVLVARDGTAFEVGHIDSNGGAWAVGQIVVVPKRVFRYGQPADFDWSAVSVEVPRKLKVPPPNVIEAVWAKSAA